MKLIFVLLFTTLAFGCEKRNCHDIDGQQVCYDERCSNGESLGCNAGGQGQNCRFCGFGEFPPCGGGPSPPPPPPPPPGPGGECTSGNGQVCLKIRNSCAYTIWPGILGSAIPDGGGFQLEAGQDRNVYVPDHWTSGRVWARTGCDGNMNCDTGFCKNSVQCSGAGGRPPVSLAEFTLAAQNAGNQDFYDVSLVDGYNIQVTIEPIAGTFEPRSGEYDCKKAGQCQLDLKNICPEELKQYNGQGQVVACQSACLKFNTDQYCCRGAFGTPETCKASTWPKNYPKIFKDDCPTAYSYAYDDHKSTFTCRGKNRALSAAYLITFC
ncbi:hypothetical protein QR680_015056 [Steinernema hermaphroditum]|uniref:Thaumatin-like protein n=1 Tax=Steinernema hermaphroditum TaxID=289476 RepID=A0AA39IAY7_9BILA|nr:hypothetical protein QR680_015056 [Steinernema hermaphroditum]